MYSVADVAISNGDVELIANMYKRAYSEHDTDLMNYLDDSAYNLGVNAKLLPPINVSDIINKYDKQQLAELIKNKNWDDLIELVRNNNYYFKLLIKEYPINWRAGVQIVERPYTNSGELFSATVYMLLHQGKMSDSDSYNLFNLLKNGLRQDNFYKNEKAILISVLKYIAKYDDIQAYKLLKEGVSDTETNKITFRQLSFPIVPNKFL